MIPGEIDYLRIPKHEFLELKAKLQADETKLAEYKRDAERYRFIRKKNDWFDIYKINHMGHDHIISTAKLDAAIDAAIASENEGRKG